MKFLSNKKNLYFTGLYLSLFAFMICSAADWGIGAALFRVLSVLLFGLFLFRGNSADNTTQNIDFEKGVMVLVVLLFHTLALWRGKISVEYEAYDIACSVVLIIMCIVFLVCNYLTYDHNKTSVKKWFVENKLILLIIICFVLLSVEVINSWFMWDAWAYYTSLMRLVRNFTVDFSGIYDLYLCGHASLGYSLWLVFFQMIQEGTASVQIADIILAGISVYAYYQILRKILGNKYSSKALVLATMPYAFSPFVMGMVGNINLDSTTMYFAVIFIACSLYNYNCLELFFAFCFCFSKEPAIIFYVVYIATKIICEYLSENRFHLWKLFKYGFGNIKNYIYACPVILCMILSKLKTNGSWGSLGPSGWDSGGFNCFGINESVVSMKLKQTFWLNFNWIFWAAIVFGLFIIIILKIKQKAKADKEVLTRTVPISVVCIITIIFGCLYITWTHVRYITPMIPLLYLTATIIVANLKWKEIRFSIWNIVLATLLLIQCFCTIDPIMKNVFRELPVGSVNLYSMQVAPNKRFSDKADLRDSIVYNRQYSYWQEILMEVLNKSGYDGNMMIVMPDDVNCKKYGYIGTEQALWNTKEGRLEYYDKTVAVPEGCVWISSCYVSEAESVWGSNSCNKILYIIPEWTNIDDSFTVDSDRFSKEIVKQGDVNKKGFHIQYVVMDMKYKASLGNGNYTVSPKQESSLGIGTDGQWLWLKERGDELRVTLQKTRYQFMFNDYQVAMDVRYNYVDSNGTVWAYEENGTNAQKWKLEKTGDYYMICWGDYALTYDLNDNSIKLTPKTGDDNQQWSFNR